MFKIIFLFLIISKFFNFYFFLKSDIYKVIQNKNDLFQILKKGTTLIHSETRNDLKRDNKIIIYQGYTRIMEKTFLKIKNKTNNLLLIMKKVLEGKETNKNNETAILKKLEEIKEQNDKLISFYELSKKKEEENQLNNRKETETNEEDVDLEYPQDTEMMQNSERVLRSFKVNTWVLGEFLRVARKKGMKIETATNKAFQIFIEKYN